MAHNITIYADPPLADAVERYVRERCPAFTVGHRAVSCADCLEPSLRNKADVLIIQAKLPIVHAVNLMYELQCASYSPVILIFEVRGPGRLRYASTSPDIDPLAQTAADLFETALAEQWVCECVHFDTMIWDDGSRPYQEIIGWHNSLMELLRGCNEKEFQAAREKFGLDLRDSGYYLFFWELMGIEFTDHKSNKHIYNFNGERLAKDCLDTISDYNGGEVFFTTPYLMCIIINDLDIKSEAQKSARLEELTARLTQRTQCKAARRYLSGRVPDIKGIRLAYERYHIEKSMAFFLQDERILRPSLIEAHRRVTRTEKVDTLLHEIAQLLHYDLANPALETCLHELYFDVLKPSMSFTLYYSSTAAIFNVLAEVQYCFDDIVPPVNNSPNLLQFSSIEEQYGIVLDRIRELQSKLTGTKRISSSIVRKAVEFINEHYEQDLTVTDIASAQFISSVHLSQRFKHEMGMGVIKYLINYRIEQAQKLLRETDDYIYAISERVGFHDFRHFSRTFKDVTSLSPTQYRKQSRQPGLSWPDW